MTAKRHSELSLIFAYLAMVACSWCTTERPDDNFVFSLTVVSVLWLTYNCVTYLKRYTL